MGCGKKSFKLLWRCHQLLSGILAKGHLPWVSHQLLMIRVIRLCTDLLAFALHLRKTSSRRPNEGAVRPVIASNRVPYLKMRSVGSHSTSGRKGCKWDVHFYVYFQYIHLFHSVDKGSCSDLSSPWQLRDWTLKLYYGVWSLVMWLNDHWTLSTVK